MIAGTTKPPSPYQAVIFDIDGTLTPEISWTTLTRDLGADTEKHRDFYRALQKGRLSYEEAKHSLLRLWCATGQADRATFTEIFESWPIYPSVPKLVRDLRGRGKRVCLITGSVDLYATVIARRLGVSDYYANTELVWDDRGALIDFHYRLDQAAVKLENLTKFCADYGLDPTDCLAVGDDENDISLFKATGRGIAVGGDIPADVRKAAYSCFPTLSEARDVWSD